MKLMTKEIEKKLAKYPLDSQDGKGGNAEVVTEYFTPYSDATWFVTEGEKQPDGDWIFFGLVKIQEWEYGYFMLSQLEEVPFIERDRYVSGTLKQNALNHGAPDRLFG